MRSGIVTEAEVGGERYLFLLVKEVEKQMYNQNVLRKSLLFQRSTHITETHTTYACTHSKFIKVPMCTCMHVHLITRGVPHMSGRHVQQESW